MDDCTLDFSTSQIHIEITFSTHPHAVHSAFGWVYTYNQNGDVVSKEKGADSFTFTYSSGLKLETVSLSGQELHHFAYDANGARVSERRSDGTLVFFVGEYYEYSLQGTEVHEKKYYGREAMREDGVLYFILTDHLGSTSIVTDGNGVKLAEQRYDAWGALRYTSGNSPTDKLYTGQRFSADLGLYDYKARWYDPLTGRFLMEDPIIPQQGVMRLDRFSYVMNNPMFFTDPEGLDICDEDGNCFDRGKLYKTFKSGPTHPFEFFLKEIYRSPIHDSEQNNPHGMGQERGTYCIPGVICTKNVIYHPGVDVGNELGTDVYAVAAGKVVFANKTNDLGYTVVIEHDVFGTKIYSVYGHLGTQQSTTEGAIFVLRDQLVSQSTHIGEMGNTKGNGTIGTHLHFEIRTSTNINSTFLGEGKNPLKGRQWWIFQEKIKASYVVCSYWRMCWLDLGLLYDYDPTYNEVQIRDK